MKEMYLDNAATTNITDEVFNAMLPYLTTDWYNPSSLYKKSVLVKQDMENAREEIAKYIGAKPSEIYFTSGGSESNCWALQGFLKRKPLPAAIVTTDLEHKSILNCAKDFELDGITVRYCPVDEYGLVDTDRYGEILESLSDFPTILVSIQYANNEIGTIQNIQGLAHIAHKYNAVFHTDAVQAFGVKATNVKNLGVDMMSVSGHKIHAPKGIGFLYIKSGKQVSPIIYGSQNDGLRGGTENVPYIIGLAEAVKQKSKWGLNFSEQEQIRDLFISRLQSEFGCKLNGSPVYRLPNNINVTFPQNITGESLIYLLDSSDIQISAGSACNSRENTPSHVLTEIGLTEAEARRTIRITIPEDMTADDVDFIIVKLRSAVSLLIGGR